MSVIYLSPSPEGTKSFCLSPILWKYAWARQKGSLRKKQLPGIGTITVSHVRRWACTSDRSSDPSQCALTVYGKPHESAPGGPPQRNSDAIGKFPCASSENHHRVTYHCNCRGKFRLLTHCTGSALQNDQSFQTQALGAFLLEKHTADTPYHPCMYNNICQTCGPVCKMALQIRSNLDGMIQVILDLLHVPGEWIHSRPRHHPWFTRATAY